MYVNTKPAFVIVPKGEAYIAFASDQFRSIWLPIHHAYSNLTGKSFQPWEGWKPTYYMGVTQNQFMHFMLCEDVYTLIYEPAF